MSTGVPWVDAMLAIGGTLGGVGLVAYMIIRVQRYLANVQTDIVGKYRDELAKVQDRLTERDDQAAAERAEHEETLRSMRATIRELQEAVSDAHQELRTKSREKHDALGLVTSYELERSALRRLAVEHGCDAVVEQLDRIDAVRAASPNWPDTPGGGGGE